MKHGKDVKMSTNSAKQDEYLSWKATEQQVMTCLGRLDLERYCDARLIDGSF